MRCFFEYGNVIFISAGLLFLNVFGAVLFQKFFVKDTGRLRAGVVKVGLAYAAELDKPGQFSNKQAMVVLA